MPALEKAKLAGLVHNNMMIEISKIKDFENLAMRELKKICFTKLAQTTNTGLGLAEFLSYEENYRIGQREIDIFSLKIIPKTTKYLSLISKIISENESPVASKTLGAMMTEVENSNELDKVDKILAITIISITKSSNEFWHDAFINQSNPFHNSLLKLINQKGLISGNTDYGYRVSVVLADAAGYASAYQQCLGATDHGCIADPECKASREAICSQYGIWNSIAASAAYAN